MAFMHNVRVSGVLLLFQIEHKSTKFFPQQEATCLTEESTTDELIESLIDKVEYVVQHFKDKVNLYTLM